MDSKRRPEPADRTKAISLPQLERLWLSYRRAQALFRQASGG